MANAISAYVTIKFVELMAKPFTEWEAYHMGLIDEDGRKIREPETREEKEQFVSWMNLIRNLRRLLLTIPGGRRKISSYTAAFMLMKESVQKEEGRTLDQYEVDFMREQFEKTLDVRLSLMQTESRTEVEPGHYRVVGASMLSNEEFRDTEIVYIGENCRSIGHDGETEILRVIDSRGRVDYYTTKQLVPVADVNVTSHIATHPVPLGVKKKKKRKRARA